MYVDVCQIAAETGPVSDVRCVNATIEINVFYMNDVNLWMQLKSSL